MKKRVDIYGVTMRRAVVFLSVWSCSSLISAQQTIPFSDLLQDRFSTIMMVSSTETCEARSCDPLEGCDQSIIDEQEAFISTATTNTSNQITKQVTVPCDPGEGGGYETRTEVNLTLVGLPFKIYRVKTCLTNEAYIADRQLEGLPEPFEIVHEIFVTSYDQLFKLVLGGSEIELELAQLLDLLFVTPRDLSIDIDGHAPCGEIACGQHCGTCSFDERIRQDRAIEYLIRETEVLDISNLVYPVTLHRLCICGGRSLWVMEEELYVFNETPYEILETIVIPSAEADVTIPDLPTNEDIIKDVSYDLVHPTCDEPTSGSILIKIKGGKIGILNQYSIYGGVNYQAAPLFKELVEGIYNIKVSSEEGVLEGIFEGPINLIQNCEERGKEKCSDGIDNDEDGLVDCQDDGCLGQIICSDYVCEILDLITIRRKGFSALNLSFKENGSTEHVAGALSNLGISLEDAQSAINNLEAVAYQLDESIAGTEYKIRDTFFLRLYSMKDDFTSLDMDVFTRIPVRPQSKVTRRVLQKGEVGSIEQRSEEDCKRDLKVNYNEEACANVSLNCSACKLGSPRLTSSDGSSVINENLQRSVLHIEHDGPQNSTIRIFDLSTNTIYKDLADVNEYDEVIQSHGPFLIILEVDDCIRECVAMPQEIEDGGSVKILMGACLSSDNILAALICHDISSDQICTYFSSDDFHLNGDKFEDVPISENGNIQVTITDGVDVLYEGVVLINTIDPYNLDGDEYDNDPLLDADIDGDGLNNDIDRDIDGDGIPNKQDDFPYGLQRDSDNDGVNNEEDGDIDNDKIPNRLDQDADGDGILNDVDIDDDNDGIPDACDESPVGPLIEECDNGIDDDGDGFVDCADLDCFTEIYINKSEGGYRKTNECIILSDEEKCLINANIDLLNNLTLNSIEESIEFSARSALLNNSLFEEYICGSDNYMYNHYGHGGLL